MMKSWTDTYGVKWYYEVFEPRNDVFLTGVATDRSEIVTPTEIEGLPVTGIKGMLWRSKAMECDDAPNVKSVIIANGIEWIRGSFWFQEKLESVMLPDSLVSIEGSSFRRCQKLCSVNLPSSLQTIGAFCECPSLQDFTIPSSVIEVGSGSFVGSGWYDRQKDGCVVKDGCLLRYKGVAPAHVVVPDGVRIVAGGAFVGAAPSRWPNARGYGACANIELIEFPASVVRYGGCLHSDDIDSVFHGRFEKLREIVLHGVTGWEHVPWVGFEMLNNDENLDGRIRVKIKDSGRVPEDAFSSCGLGVTAVSSVEIAHGVTSIEKGAFSGCSQLRSLKMADSVMAICNGAFDNCDKLESVVFSDNIKWLSGFNGCGGLKSAMLPPRVIEVSGFCECTGLTDLIVPGSVKRLDDAFRKCESLVRLTIQNGIETIGGGAFSHCARLDSSVRIPDSVQAIESGTFYDTAIWNTSGDCWRGEGLGLVVLDGWVLGVRGNGDKGCPKEIVVPKGCGRIRGVARNLMYDCLYPEMNENDGWREPWKAANTILTIPGVGQWKCGGEKAFCVSRYESWYEIKT